MILLAPIIIEDGIDQSKVHKMRTTVRGIIRKGNKVLMVYSPTFSDYTFPGGGVKDGEDLYTALYRELKEELGVTEIKDIEPYGILKELRHGLNKNGQTYEQTSYYYTCEVGTLGLQNLAWREQQHGVIPTWVDIKEALKQNMSIQFDHHHTKEGMKTVIMRENTILRTLLEDVA